MVLEAQPVSSLSSRSAVADGPSQEVNDTQVGIAIRRWCAPLLGLPMGTSADEYLSRRREISNEDAAAIFLPAAGFGQLLVDTGYQSDRLIANEALSALAGVPVRPIVRLEALAESVARSGPTAVGFGSAFQDALGAQLVDAVGLKSIIAYRFGLDFDPVPPGADEVVAHAGAWLRSIESSGAVRLEDPVLLRHVLWTGARTGLPLQVHAGYGDTDLDLHRSDPLLMTGFLRATEQVCPVLLLHNYPFHRNAGYLAQMFAHVYLDVGLAVNYTGAQSRQVIAESLELAPFTKILFSSDAWGAPELHLLGSWLFRRGMARVVGGWVASGDWSSADAQRTISLIAGQNARRVYAID
ncbi:MAG: amidohydrolase family protein [Chloroflexi bacterium]|nr:amidohydrolase family protein [Chloroflexota bacterium]